MDNEKPVHVPRAHYPEAYTASISPAAPPSLNGYPDSDSVHLLDYLHVLVARRWTVIAIFLTVVIITIIATLKQVPIYQASTTLQIDRENPNVLSFKDVYEVESATDDTLQTQYKVLGSRSLARRVIEELHLDRSEEFRPGDPKAGFSYMTFFRSLLGSAPAEPKEEPDHLRPVIDAYLARLNITPVRQARLVAVAFDSKDPKLAADIINAHAAHYKEQNLQFKWDATQEASEFLEQQLVNLKANLEKSEDRLQAYSREKQILFTEQGRNTATEKLQQLEGEFTKAQSDRFQRESYNRLVAVGRSDALPQLMDNQLITNLTSRLADLQREESEVAVTFSAEYPRRKRIRSQIEDIQRTITGEKERVVETVQAEYSAAVERERLLSAALEEQRNEVNNINQEIIQYNILKRETDSNKELYDGLLTRLKEAQVSAGLRASNIRVVDRAEVPRAPVRPRKAFNLLVGSLLGLVFGVGFAFFQEHLDNSIKSPEDVNRFLNVPTLGTIPNMQSLSNGHSYGYGYGYKLRASRASEKNTDKAPLDLITHASPTSLMSEAYRSTRTSLLLSSADRSPRVVLITSAIPSEGKTVTAINTAISLTQTGGRVVLVDADMRKPRVHSVFSLGNVPGLSSFLTGSANLKDVIHEVQVPNLYVLSCGVIPPNPAELVLSSRFNQLIQVLRQYFDYVVIDSPPIANVSDARILASKADASILVVKAFSTSRHLAKRAVDHLMQSRAGSIGVILNDLNVHARTNYYSSYSNRYYYPSNYEAAPPPST